MTWRLLFWSLIGPFLFLVAVVGFSIVAVVSGVREDQVEAAVSAQGSAILLVALLGLGLLSLRLPLREIWATPRSAAADLAIGAALGAVLAGIYLVWLSPVLIWAQGQFGDYVPAGVVRGTITGNLWLFAVANVVLAPLVEETVYRGYLLPRLVGRFGVVAGLVVSCVAFGLLHWLGGVWYMALTGAVAGGMFAGLRLWRGSLLAPFAAHLSLNILEFAAAAVP